MLIAILVVLVLNLLALIAVHGSVIKLAETLQPRSNIIRATERQP